jgi:hypothetical protein
MVATLTALGALGEYPIRVLSPVARPAVLGGGQRVGDLEPKVELEWA